MTGINTYLKIRRYVLFMANPRFYLYTYVPALILAGVVALLFGREGFKVVLIFWDAYKSISDFLFFAGTGEYTKDAHIVMTVVLPSIIALAWHWMEKLTGIQARLKRNGLIPE